MMECDRCKLNHDDMNISMEACETIASLHRVVAERESVMEELNGKLAAVILDRENAWKEMNEAKKQAAEDANARAKAEGQANFMKGQLGQSEDRVRQLSGEVRARDEHAATLTTQMDKNVRQHAEQLDQLRAALPVEDDA
jgi:chromosome segregation ATPase